MDTMTIDNYPNLKLLIGGLGATFGSVAALRFVPRAQTGPFLAAIAAGMQGGMFLAPIIADAAAQRSVTAAWDKAVTDFQTDEYYRNAVLASLIGVGASYMIGTNLDRLLEGGPPRENGKKRRKSKKRKVRA